MLYGNDVVTSWYFRSGRIMTVVSRVALLCCCNGTTMMNWVLLFHQLLSVDDASGYRWDHMLWQ